MKKSIVLSIAMILGSLVFAQSAEQRAIAKEVPLQLRVKEVKATLPPSAKSNTAKKSTKEKVKVKKMAWQATISGGSTNLTRKIELKAYYVGQQEGELDFLKTDTKPIEFESSGKAQILLESPVTKLVKTDKGSSGDRIDGLIAQLLVDGTVIRTFASKPVWAKVAWQTELKSEDLLPNKARQKKDSK